MKRSRRPNHQRLNYRVLHSDGIKTVVSSSDSESDSVSDTDSQDLSNTSNKLLDPLLISRFEELSCQTNSKIQFDPVKESITQSVSNSLEKDSVISTTVLESAETETQVLESDQESSFIQPSSVSPAVNKQSCCLIQSNSVNETTITQSVSNPLENDSVISTTVLESPETETQVLESDQDSSSIKPSSLSPAVNEPTRCLIQSYQPLLSDKASFEISSTQISVHDQNPQNLLPPEISVHSGLARSSSNSFLDSSVVSLSEFATPLINSTFAFDFGEVNSNLQTEPFYWNSDSNEQILITNDQLLNSFSLVAHHVYGLKVLIDQALRPCRQKFSPIMSVIPSTEAGLAQKALGTDLDDYIDENPIADCESTDEVDACISRVEDLCSV